MSLQRLIRNNWLWFVLTVACGAGLQFIKNSQAGNPVSISAGIGTFFLLLTLLPGNIQKLPIGILERPRIAIGKLVKYRRDLGIVTGFVFLFHVMIVLSFSPTFSIQPLLTNANAPGAVGILLLLLILCTSNAWGFRILKGQWKSLQSLVWFLVPLGFVHGMLIKWQVEHELSKITLIGFGSIVAFVVLEYALNVLQGQRSSSAKRHLLLTFLGAIVAALMVWLVP